MWSKHLVVLLVGLLLSGLVFSASSDSWFGLWVGLEVSSLAIYPWLVGEKSEAFCSSLFKLLVLQVLSSAVLYIGFVILSGPYETFLGGLVITLSLHLKFGSLFVGWIECVIEAIEWQGVALILGVQKIPVVLVLFNVIEKVGLIASLCSGITLAVVGCIGCACLSLRSFLLISSLSNIGWVWCASTVSQEAAGCYFMVYLSSFIMLCGMFMLYNRIELSSVFGQSGLSGMECILLGNVSGLPPLAVFFCKVETIHLMVGAGFMYECWILITSSVVLLYVYISMVLSVVLSTWSLWVLEKESENGINGPLVGSAVGIVLGLLGMWWAF